MRNKTFLFIVLLAIGLICSCTLKNNNPQQQDFSEFGDYGDSDDPAEAPEGSDVTSNSQGLDFKFKFNKDGGLYLLFSTLDGNSFYLYNDEVDYSSDVFYSFILLETIKP